MPVDDPCQKKTRPRRKSGSISCLAILGNLCDLESRRQTLQTDHRRDLIEAMLATLQESSQGDTENRRTSVSIRSQVTPERIVLPGVTGLRDHAIDFRGETSPVALMRCSVQAHVVPKPQNPQKGSDTAHVRPFVSAFAKNKDNQSSAW